MAMVDRTAVSGQTVDEFKASFGDRLVALARVQGLLSRAAPGDSVPFDRLLESELSAQSENGGTVTLDGPPAIVLRSDSVQALGMALHELATNAVKYGAIASSPRPTARLSGLGATFLPVENDPGRPVLGLHAPTNVKTPTLLT